MLHLTDELIQEHMLSAKREVTWCRVDIHFHCCEPPE